MLIVYLSQETALIQSGDPPAVGDPFPGGGQVASIEVYKGDDESVVLALLEPIYHEPEESFNVQLDPDRKVINYGWSMIGRPPVGRLMDYDATNHETLMRPTPSRWYVDQIETCKPVAEGTYTAIHICFCVNAPVAAAA